MMRRWTSALVGASAFLLSACAHESVPETPATPEAAWNAWQSGDAAQARALGERLALVPDTANEGRHVAALAAHVTGDHNAAFAHYDAIALDYPRRRELRSPVYESFLHAGRPADALRLAQENAAAVAAQARAQARVDHPMQVTITGLVELPFEADALTPYMPGVRGTLNGHDVVFRFDTGGAFVNMSPALATQYGVRSEQCAQGFANLQATQVCYGVADIALGDVGIVNAPVAVIASLPAETNGVPLGPVLGANFYAEFLATMDSPGQRLLLSPRTDARAAREHMARLQGVRTEAPFLLWSDHFILARGGVGARRDAMFFVDSGLVAMAPDGVQASLLLAQSQAADLAGIVEAAPGAIVETPAPISLGAATQSAQRVMVLPDAAWASFGTFGGVAVRGLISYGFLKHYAWTLDFDRRVIVLTETGG